MVTVGSFPMNVYRAGPGPVSAKRTIGKGIFRSFQSSFNAQGAAADILEMLLNGNDGVFGKYESGDVEKMFKSVRSKRRGGSA